MRNDQLVRRHGALAVLLGLLTAMADAEAPQQWQAGDVFVAAGDGAYRVFAPDGGLKHTLRDNQGGYTTACGFGPELDRLYTTNYTHTSVVVFDAAGDRPVEQIIATNEVSPRGHSSSIAFDAEGRFFVGHPDGNRLVHKYDGAGMLLETYDVAREKRGATGLDLAADQSTLYYTTSDRTVYRYDTALKQQMEVFVELPDDGEAVALRLLPPGDGSGGLLLADGLEIKRLDGTGEVVRTYDAEGLDDWFALNLDPNGTTFWAADSEVDRLVQFGIRTGEVVRQIEAGSGESIFGVCVHGELDRRSRTGPGHAPFRLQSVTESAESIQPVDGDRVSIADGGRGESDHIQPDGTAGASTGSGRA